MWQVKIQDPSGETRNIALRGHFGTSILVGNDTDVDVPLRDATLPKSLATVWTQPIESHAEGSLGLESPFWIKSNDPNHPIHIGDLEIRESKWPAELPIRIGETTMLLSPMQSEITLPKQPANIRPWLSVSESGKRTLWMAKKAASTPLSVYLAGETGTGKEVLAQLLHAWSGRSSGPFVPLHCGALPLSLAESELFGHVKGAFTGASQHRAGALMQAHNGTLFLDEIGDLPLDIQVKLLRFLENGEIRPVGADHTSRADVRLLCATHHPLLKLVEEGKFRRDLYYRLASITIEIPPLRSRPDDIEMLARLFAKELNRNLTARAILKLKMHSWPGNVRELRHAIERATGLGGEFVEILGEDAFEFLQNNDTSQNLNADFDMPLQTLEEMERIHLIKALKLVSGNRAKAAKILGVARSTLFEMIKRHKILGPRKRD